MEGDEAEMDASVARMRRYAEAIYSGDMTLGHRDRRDTRNAVARAIIAVADEEQAELRAEIERLRYVESDLAHARSAGESYKRRAEAAEKRLAAVEATADEPGSGFPYVRVTDLHAALAVPADAPEA